MKTKDDLTDGQKQFMTAAALTITAIALKIEPRLTPQEFTECLELMHYHSDTLMREKYQPPDEQTICE